MVNPIELGLQADTHVVSAKASSKFLEKLNAKLPPETRRLIIHNPFDGEVIIPEKMIWTASSVKLFRQCPRKFFWKYLMRLVPRVGSPALAVGTKFHECLGKWYKSKKSSMAKITTMAMKELTEVMRTSAALFDEEDAVKMEMQVNTFEGMLNGYAKIYEGDREVWDFDRDIGIERQFLIDMGPFFYAGSIDGVFREKKTNWGLEHKTASLITPEYIQRLALDTQIQGYQLALSMLTEEPVSGIVYNVTQKSKLRRKSNEPLAEFRDRVIADYTSQPSKYFYRERIQFTRSQLAEFCLNLLLTHAQFTEFCNTSFVTKPNAWYTNDSHCNAYFKMCEYHDLCTRGLDKGTSLGLTQIESMHRELGDEPTI
jgi:hypothetical protein